MLAALGTDPDRVRRLAPPVCRVSSWFRPRLASAPSTIQTRLRHFDDPDVPNHVRPRRVPRIRSARCGSWSSPTSSPTRGAPQRGRWVRDQIEEIRRRGVEVEIFGFPPGSRQYLPAMRRLRAAAARRALRPRPRPLRAGRLVRALAGARPLIVSFHGTDVRHPVVGPMSRRLSRRVDLTAAVSRALFARGERPPGPAAPARLGGPALRPRPGPLRPAAARRGPARARPRPRRPLPALPRQPGRPEKRADRAAELAAACGAELLSGGAIDPDRMPLWINAANAVLVTSDYEGFGMVCIEALACEVPVLSTPVGIAPFAPRRLDGALCAPFDARRLAAAARASPRGRRPAGRGRRAGGGALRARMAERTIEAYRDVLAAS